jgi:hypothetical protein
MDFTAAVNSVLGNVLAAFGEQVTYVPAVGAPYSVTPAGNPLLGVFDEAYQGVDPNTQTVISSTQPILLVRLSDLAAPAAKGDRVTVRGTRTFTVTKTEPDGRGGTLLFLHKA